MTDLTLDDWRALVARLGERSPDRRALADRELRLLDKLVLASAWEPLTAAQVAAELGRVFGSLAGAHQRERSEVIAEALTDADPLKRSPVGDVAQALNLSEPSARRLIAAHRSPSAQADAVSARQAVSAR